MITRNLNTPESREFWAAAERAARRVETWPAWKLGQIEPRRAESMATKKEIWYNYHDNECDSEFDALTDDIAFGEDAQYACDTGNLSPRLIAAIDALHEYAHRGDKAPDTQRDTGITLPEGVPPELDDWVKRWDWITAKVSVDAIRELRKGDEVRIGLNWYPVVSAYQYGSITRLAFEAVRGEFVPTVADELAAIANEVRYNDR